MTSAFCRKQIHLKVQLGLVIRHQENPAVGILEVSTAVSCLSYEIAEMLCFHSLCTLALSPHCCILGCVPGEPNKLPFGWT